MKENLFEKNSLNLNFFRISLFFTYIQKERCEYFIIQYRNLLKHQNFFLSFFNFFKI